MCLPISFRAANDLVEIFALKSEDHHVRVGSNCEGPIPRLKLDEMNPNRTHVDLG